MLKAWLPTLRSQLVYKKKNTNMYGDSRAQKVTRRNIRSQISRIPKDWENLWVQALIFTILKKAAIKQEKNTKKNTKKNAGCRVSAFAKVNKCKRFLRKVSVRGSFRTYILCKAVSTSDLDDENLRFKYMKYVQGKRSQNA